MACSVAKMRAMFDDYCPQSGMKCFAFLKASMNKLEYALWVFFILLFSSVTLYNVCMTVDKYIKRPTITKVTVQNDFNITLPRDPVLCFGIDPEDHKGYTSDVRELKKVLNEFVDSAAASFTSDGQVDIGAFLRSVLQQAQNAANADLGNFVDSILNASGSVVLKINSALFVNARSGSRYLSKDSTVYASHPAFQAFVSATAQFLIELVRMENGNELDGLYDDDVLVALDDADPFLSSMNMEIYDTLVDIFVRGKSPAGVRTKPVELRELLELIGSLMCLQSRVSVFQATQITYADNSAQRNKTFQIKRTKPSLQFDMPCMKERITWLGDRTDPEASVLCVGLNRSYFRFGFGKSDATYITLSPARLFDPTVLVPDTLVDIYDGSVDAFSLDFMGLRRPSLPSNTELATMYYMSQRSPFNEINVAISGRFVTMNLNRSPCSESLMIDDCYGICRAKFLVQRCNCWPFSWSRAPDYGNVRYCFTSPNDLECLFSNFTLTATDDDCKTRCYKFCDHTMLVPTATITSIVDELGVDGATALEVTGTKKSAASQVQLDTYIKVVSKSFTYPKFVEVLEMDEKAFLSALGGSLSLWIGCSFMALLHIIVYCARLPFLALRDSKKKQEKQKADQSSHFRPQNETNAHGEKTEKMTSGF